MQGALAGIVACLLAASAWTRAASPAEAAAPPGLPPVGERPQFVLLTHDDGIKSDTAALLRKLTDKRRSANGCPLVATLFAYTKPGNFDCKELVKLYRRGFEVAAHTVSHKRLPGQPRSYVEQEVEGNRAQLAKCGIPEQDIRGFRAPYLDVDPQLRAVLHASGFLYDSSILSQPAAGFGQRPWPFDMAGGIPWNCTASVDGEYGSHRQQCSPNERLPGLWEVPMWRLTELDGPFTMDPGFSYKSMRQASRRSAFDILRANLDAALAGNRAPMPLYVHPFYLRESGNLEDVARFIDYALTKREVIFVSMQQLVAWMQNPLPLSKLAPKVLGCGSVGGRPGSLASPKRQRQRSRRA